MFLPVTMELLRGFWETVKIFFLTLAFSLPLGLVVAFGSMSRFRPLKRLTQGFVWIIRGTPLMLQLIAIFYGPGLLFDIHILGRFEAVIVAFVINYACYFSEIYRGGIESVPRGQYEAGQVLGMTKSQIFFKVVLLQVVKRILAPMGNEFITLRKVHQEQGHHLASVLHRGVLSGVQRRPDGAVCEAGKETELFQGLRV